MSAKKRHPIMGCRFWFNRGELLPVVELGSVKTDVSSLEYGILAFLLLSNIVVESSDCNVAEHEACGDVDEAHECHQNVSYIPCETHLEACACEDNESAYYAIAGHERLAGHFALVEECECVIAVEQVADKGGECKENHCEGDEYRSKSAEDGLESFLDIGSACEFSSGLDAGRETHESGSGADEDGVDKYGQHLNKTLLNGVRNISCSCCVRSGAYACLVGIETALDAVHHAGACNAAEDSREVESVSKDLSDDTGQQTDVHNNDDKSNCYVDNAHERNDGGSSLDNALAAAKQAPANDNSENCTDDEGSYTFVIERVSSKGGLQVVGSEHIEADSIGEDEEYRESNGKTAILQSILNVVSGTAVAVAVFIAELEYLSKSAFDKCRSAANDGDEPHPEHSTVAAEAYSGGNAYDITGSYTGSGGYHKSLERRYRAFLRGLLCNYLDRFAEKTSLNEVGFEGEPKTCGDENDYQDGIIEHTAQFADHCTKHFETLLSLKYFLRQAHRRTYNSTESVKFMLITRHSANYLLI